MRTPKIGKIDVIATCVLSIFSVSAATAQSWDTMRPTLNLYGNVGILDTPTAHTMNDADLSFTANASLGSGERVSRYVVNSQLGGRLSGTFRYTEIEEFSELTPYLDRGFDVRYLFAEEGDIGPAISIGLNDLAGTGFYSSEYIVATKTFNRLRTTVGLGWGRLAEVGGFSNPLGAISSSFDTRPEQAGGANFEGTGELDSSHWFRGDVAVFGGMQYLATDKLILGLEYSSNGYDFERENLGFEYQTPINADATYRFDNGIDLSAAYLHGTTLSLQMNYVINAKNPTAFPTGQGDAPQALIARPRYSAADLGWSLSADDLNQGADRDLNFALQVQGLDLIDFAAEGKVARLQYRNLSHVNEARAVGRAVRVLSRNAPKDIETFVLEPVTDHGLTGQRITLQRTDFEELEYADDGAWKSFARADFDSGFESSVPLEFSSNLDWWVGPYVWSSVFDPRYKGRLQDAGVETGFRFMPVSNWVLGGSVQYRLFGGMDPDVEASTASQNVPKVRTGARQYEEATKLALQDLYVSKYSQPTDNIYGRFSIGYLEHMYGGVSGEVLWMPQTNRLALGAELNWVKQREFERGFGFQDYDVVTGHVSAYLHGGNGFHYQVDAGRYLAGDWGSTFKLEREFGNGIRLGAFVTFTNMETSDFGEGSYDKGLSFDIPLSALTGKRGKQTIKGNFRPVLGDGGARVIVPGRLYEELRNTRQERLQQQWGHVFR